MATREEALAYLATIHRYALREPIDVVRSRLMELQKMLYTLDDMPVVEAKRGELHIFNIPPNIVKCILAADYYCVQEGVGGRYSTDLSFPHNKIVRLPDGTRVTRFGNIIREI